MGTNGAPAIGELTKLLDEPSHALTAFGCLANIGKLAEAVLCRGLTNQDARVRQASVLRLADVTDDMETYVTRIKGCLGDSSEFVRSAAVYGISAQTAAPDLAVPLLVDALKDSSDPVSSSAAGALGDFGTNSLIAIPALSNLVEHGTVNAANAALRSLVSIAPNESVTILTQCVAHGFPPGALSLLAGNSPDIALPILLAGTRSLDLNRRRMSFRLLCDYTLTPDIRAVIQGGTADPDVLISMNAKRFLTIQYRNEHPTESQFSDEPDYLGKGLGEWLKTKRNPDGSFPKDTVEAFYEMGTNAIPALLVRLVYTELPFGIRTREGSEVNLEALCAFIALGEQAKSALPQLWALMDSTNENIALFAMMASCGTGSNAMPFLVKGLTNQFADVRNEAANNVAGDLGAKFPALRKQAIPLLLKLLNDPDKNVRMNATNELKGIAPDVAAKVGIK